MELEVYWTQFAEGGLADIFDYYKYKAGVNVAERIVNEIINESIKLEKSPYIGQLESLLIDRIQQYRYFVYKNYKLIYWIDEINKIIFISHIFDTRQNPIKIKNF